MSVGGNIRALRLRKGLSQADLALRVGVAKETVSRWETDRLFIRQNHLTKLAEILETSRNDILCDDGRLASPLETDDTVNGVSAGVAHQAPSEAMRFVYQIERSGNGTTLRQSSQACIPLDVALRHPRSVLVRMQGQEMAKAYPPDSLLLIDQHVKPWNGCSVVALVDNSKVVIRRFLCGNNTIVLSGWSYGNAVPDLILDKRRVRILGAVVWFQASHDVTQ